MRLKRLEMCGFKSFPTKTTLDLEKGVTVIVGPNGCGKSNIADAIRWVLGERKTSALRTSRMEEVIFNGTESRKPLNMAEASMIIDNSDGVLPVEFSEVCVTRRFFRSDESEYCLNRVPCRRQDILELFMDTGVGLNSFSLIEQGQVDMVLSSRPEDRRFLFEDAAGIVKYKTRKRAALRKLERTSNNLLRLQDTIVEVKRQIGSLKRQASAAKRYKTLQDELRELEIELALLEFLELKAEYKSASRSVSELQARVNDLNEALLRSERDTDDWKTDLTKADEDLSGAQQKLRYCDSQINKAQADIARSQEQIKAFKETQRQASHDITTIRSKVITLKDELQKATDSQDLINTELGQAKDKLAQRQRDLETLAREMREAQESLEENRQRNLEVLNEKVQLQNALNLLVANIEASERRLSSLLAEKEETSEKSQSLVRNLEASSEEVRRKEEHLNRLEARKNELAQELSAEQTLLEEGQERLQDVSSRLGTARARLQSLEELSTRFEGLHSGVKAVLSAKKQGEQLASGVRGVVADLITSDRRFEAVLEAALANRMQDIVTEGADDAVRCIKYLHDTGEGEATFIPLSAIPLSNGREAFDHILGTPGVVGWAIDLLTCEEKYRPVMEHLLGTTLVVDTLERAIEITRGASHHHPSLVSLTGAVISTTGAMRGGRHKKETPGLLARRNEIAELRGTVATLETETQERKKTVQESAGKEAELQQTAAAAEGDVRDAYLALAECNRNHEQLSERVEQARQDHDSLKTEMSALERDRQELLTERESEGNRLSASCALERQLTTAVKESATQCAQFEERRNDLLADITDLKVTVSSYEVRQNAGAQMVERLNRLISENETQVNDKLDGYENSRRSQAETERRLTALQDEFGGLRMARLRAEETIGAAQTARKSLVDRIRSSEAAMKSTRTNLQEETTKKHELDLRCTHLRDRIVNLEEGTFQKHHISLDSLGDTKVVNVEMPPEQARDRVEFLEGKLAAMGPVNLMAIEQYDELQNRYDFLVQQQQDLIEAKESLVHVVKRIDEVTEQMFTATFAKVQANFHEIFRELFGGGRARLSLVDEQDVLESGIEIEVCPPGKRPLSLALLSGGEKALTAIALLFAIFKTRPSPACVLDEIDAALDDANIDRFVRMVKRFSSQTQFLIITHNKRTMELADVLHGVTMNEKGVSQLVSVEFAREAHPEFGPSIFQTAGVMEPTPAP